ncbi:aminoglycoside phosphotransferase (APT) family kinase protein [Catenuloplanes nepalensis]|uniref:Aminoglycoside phosphotransferase (APT) family kinase protein n=1 Tax=Catenuloplanes nepalensis TaxID=587533 RepID=A0ABT9MN66_9ACTN|nr:phosphotransferase [Catenuloplanes nepalensis]MDP9792501.1 aminoglycoside phosphotransferase (APT) family kinase protein [Catenuloplanes nepalensis]
MSTTLTAEVSDELTRGLNLVRRHAGLPDGEAHLMRFTINAVYRIGDSVVRLARGEAALRRAATVVAGTALLHQYHVPSIELDSYISQPIAVEDWVATVWRYQPHPPGRPEPVDLAAPLTALHAIIEFPTFLPRWSPVANARRRLARTLTLPAKELAATRIWSALQVGMPLDDLIAHLQARADDLERKLPATRWDLAPGVIHGDAHVGNLLADRLCDFDSLAIGPREWDLVPLAHGVTRFSDALALYEQFVAAYNYDLRTAQAWPLLREIRDLQLTTSVLDNLAGRPEVANTLARRLRTYLDGNASAAWARYR